MRDFRDKERKKAAISRIRIKIDLTQNKNNQVNKVCVGFVLKYNSLTF